MQSMIQLFNSIYKHIKEIILRNNQRQEKVTHLFLIRRSQGNGKGLIRDLKVLITPLDSKQWSKTNSEDKTLSNSLRWQIKTWNKC